MLAGMRNPKKSESASETRRPKLSSGPRQYVDVNDLRSMLKLGLGLHTLGDPLKRWNKAAGGMARLCDADAWVAMVVTPRERGITEVSGVTAGGKAADLARAAAERIELEIRKPGEQVFKKQKLVPGRVGAAIENERDIHTFLMPEESGPATWISVHRRTGAAPFEERERRIVELFHSQSAWVLLQLDL
jgi:hypothetical protein